MLSHRDSTSLLLITALIAFACSSLLYHPSFTHASVNNFYNIKHERNTKNGTQPVASSPKPMTSTKPVTSTKPASSTQPMSSPKPVSSTPKPLPSTNNNNNNGNGTSNGSYYYEQYCVMAWAPYCNGGCNKYADKMISCNGKCQTLWLNATISSSMGVEPCFDIDNGQYYVYCRTDPVSDKVCFRESRQSYESCYRKKQLMDYNYFTYANSAFATPYYLIMAKGTCANQQVETEFERAFYFSYCENIAFNYPIDNANAPSELIIYKVSGTAEEKYTVKLGSSIKTEVLNDYAVGISYTGNKVCFTNKETKTRYYPLGLNPDYTSKCWDFCVTREQFLTSGAKITMSTTISQYGQSQESSFVYKGVTSNQPTNPDASGRLNSAQINHITQWMLLISLFLVGFL